MYVPNICNSRKRQDEFYVYYVINILLPEAILRQSFGLELRRKIIINLAIFYFPFLYLPCAVSLA